MSSLKDKKIIVTGASGGIGNSIVEKLNQNGANILATGTRIEKLEELKKKFLNLIFLNMKKLKNL
jgi:3-oxoacyl-[acyl-carrier protein] reductase